MRNEGLGSWPARRARKTPDATALIQDGRRTTFAELDARVTRLAHAFRELGIRRGDRVAYLGANHPAYLETLFATGVLGGVFVPLNARLTGAEISYQLSDSGAAVLVHAAAHDALVAGVRDQVPVRAYVRLDAAGPPAGSHRFEELIATAPDGRIDEPVGLGDTSVIMYTSGTTGRPKGAALTHGNLTWNAVNVLVDLDLTAGEVALVSAPLFHTAALNMLTLPVLLKGGCCVLVDRFDPDATCDLIARHRITFMFGVPAMFQQVARSPRWPEADVSSLRILTCGGSPVPTSLIDTYQRRGLTFLQGYGMTEASPGVLFLDAAHGRAKAGSAGVPHFFTDVRVVAPGPGLDDVAPGEAGEVIVRGPHVMPGYWGMPEETAGAFTDGWFRSGDLARIDRDGYVYVVDRIKDMIISGGENIYPAEIENAVSAHPDVLECAVIGVPDETWGEIPRALVVARPEADPSEEAILAGLAGRLARYKIPKSVLFVNELPRNPSGKLLKHRLREMYGQGER